MFLEDLEEVVEQPTHAIGINILVDLSLIALEPPFELVISMSGLCDAPNSNLAWATRGQE